MDWSFGQWISPEGKFQAVYFQLSKKLPFTSNTWKEKRITFIWRDNDLKIRPKILVESRIMDRDKPEIPET